VKIVLAKAKYLSRQIYASLPWGFRVAHLLLKLSFSLTDTLGKVIYAHFLQAGVTGLPPINGQDALAAPETLYKHPERLPTGYGKNFANKIYAHLIRKTRSPDLAEEVVSDIMVLLTKGIGLKQGIPLGQAEAYIFRLVNFTLVDIMRKAKNDVSLDSPTDDEDFSIDLADPKTFQDLDELIPRSELEAVLREIGKVHPKAVDWFKAQLEGVSDRELAEAWGVSAPRVNQLVGKFAPEVKRIIQEHLH
jgi:DNA-directed RNA polymerase specialized sigma24 family protein